MNGNYIIIKVNDTPVAACKSGELQNGCETIEIASATQEAFKEFLAGRAEWSVNASYLVTTAANLEDVLLVRSTVTLDIVDRAGAVTMRGSAIVTNCKQTYTKGSVANGSFQFKGTGAIAKVTT